MNSIKKKLSGWGLYPTTESLVCRAEKMRDLQHVEAPWIARGLGRCYGDAAQLTDGYVVLTERLNRILAFDREKGILRAEAGATLNDLIGTCLPYGWFPPVTPGTKWVTLGGCVAADVHGKNHHADGAFGKHVLSMELALPNGSTVKCSPTQEAALFWATVGGMGLTGAITEVTVQMQRVPSAYISVRHYSANNLDHLFEMLGDGRHDDRYSVAWVDCMAHDSSFGRGVVMAGHHARPEELDGKEKHPFRVERPKPLAIPFAIPRLLLSRNTIKKFNQVYYSVQSRKNAPFIVDYDTYFYPLDVLVDWNRIYGKKGFVQYQFATPPQTSKETCRRVLEALAQAGFPPYLAVLKRFGPEGQGLLSFPQEGYTLALDIPIRSVQLFPLLDKLDDIVAGNGGRIYLAKDARMAARHLPGMYPRLASFKEVKKRMDPAGQVVSDLSQRLQI